MNKKRLSVVMAGAMLASSVAPVLAATESELDSSRLGTLTEDVYKKLTEKVFSKGDTLAGKSVYYVKINGKDAKRTNGSLIKDMTLATDAEKEALRKELQEAFKDLTAGDTVEIWSEGFREDKDGKLFSETEAVAEKYSFNNQSEAEEEAKKIKATLEITTTPVINETDFKAFNYDDVKGTLTVTFASGVVLEKMPAGYEHTKNTITLKGGQDKLDFSKYAIASDNNPHDLVAGTVAGNIKGFFVADKKAGVIDAEKIETIKITGTQYNYKTTDLYDGLMLTTEGHELLSLVKEIRRDGNGDTTAVIKNLYGYAYDAKDPINDLKADKNGEFGFVLVVKDAFDKTTEYTVKGAEKQTEVLASWLNNELAKVDILAGNNRYETAVSIAKEQLLLNAADLKLNPNKKVKNIVLVNGDALVDGLSAAPLAAKLGAGKNIANTAAPVLLTEADELPRATRTYLLELMTGQTIGTKEKATVHLVGGTSVLNRSLEKELEGMGFKVVRYNGDNREETSLKVAEKIIKLGGNDSKAFVVGAEGEADAMSISGYASSKGIPVIVSKKGGLTYEGLKAIKGDAVTVIGGEKAVSAEEYEAIKEEAGAARRISGENRQATNAAIIKEFYHNTGVNTTESVIVAKDGRGNNKALIDALTAANLAAQTNAPVVLATKSLTDDQLDAIKLRAKSADSLYQVGIGVERPVVEEIAARLGLLNK